MSQQQARVCADDNCVTWAAAESSRTWAVPGHRSTPIFLTIFYPFIQTSLETYAHDIGFMTQAEYAAAHCPCPGLSSFLWVELPACHFPNTICSSQLWAEKPLPEESHRSDSVLWVNPALEGHSHLRGRKQEEEASWGTLKRAAASILTQPFIPQPTSTECLLRLSMKGLGGGEERKKKAQLSASLWLRARADC